MQKKSALKRFVHLERRIGSAHFVLTKSRCFSIVLPNRTPIQDACLRFGVHAACSSVLLFGAGNRNRTYDLIITNDALYQLSYPGAGADFKALARVGQCAALRGIHQFI